DPSHGIPREPAPRDAPLQPVVVELKAVGQATGTPRCASKGSLAPPRLTKPETLHVLFPCRATSGIPPPSLSLSKARNSSGTSSRRAYSLPLMVILIFRDQLISNKSSPLTTKYCSLRSPKK